jgi:PIN domain nuclease of toxin-antitoxin system
VCQLDERGRIVLGMSFDQWCDRLERTIGLHIVPLERAHVSEARALPALRDPFDRLIVGTALAMGLPLITSDTRVTDSHRVRVLW